MKRLLLIMLCLAIVLPLFGTALANDWEPKKPAYTNKVAKVYEYSYPMKNVIDTIPYGTAVDLVKFSGDAKHYRVLYAGGEKAGWVAVEDLTRTMLDTVYWAVGGRAYSYHINPACQLTQISDGRIRSGTVQQAIAAGRGNPCSTCIK